MRLPLDFLHSDIKTSGLFKNQSFFESNGCDELYVPSVNSLLIIA